MTEQLDDLLYIAKLLEQIEDYPQMLDVIRKIFKTS